MKIESFGQPMYRVTITRTLLRSLMTCSAMHYDAVCRSYSLRVGEYGAPLNGKFRIIQDFYLNDDEKRSEWAEVFSWSELDTTLKIIEIASLALLDRVALEEIKDFRRAAYEILLLSNTESADWITSVDTGECLADWLGPWPFPTRQSMQNRDFLKAWLPGFVNTLTNRKAADLIKRSGLEDPA